MENHPGILLPKAVRCLEVNHAPVETFRSDERPGSPGARLSTGLWRLRLGFAGSFRGGIHPHPSLSTPSRSTQTAVSTLRLPKHNFHT